MECEHAELEAFYRRYLQRCNEHRFDELGEFVERNVEVNGERLGLRGYADGLAAVVEAFPDYHWDLKHLLVERLLAERTLGGHGHDPGWPVREHAGVCDVPGSRYPDRRGLG